MKALLTCAAVLCLPCSTASAASLHVVKTNGGRTNAIYLEGGAHNGLFNTVKLEATPIAPATFARGGGLSVFIPRPAGEPFPYLNWRLPGDPLDGGLGWSLLGTSITAQSLGFSGGPLGQTISTAAEPDGRLFIANAHFDLLGQGVAKVQLSDALGNIVANLEAPFGVPEPAGLAWIGLVGLATRIRRTFPSQSPVAPSIL